MSVQAAERAPPPSPAAPRPGSQVRGHGSGSCTRACAFCALLETARLREGLGATRVHSRAGVLPGSACLAVRREDALAAGPDRSAGGKRWVAEASGQRQRGSAGRASPLPPPLPSPPHSASRLLSPPIPRRTAWGAVPSASTERPGRGLGAVLGLASSSPGPTGAQVTEGSRRRGGGVAGVTGIPQRPPPSRSVPPPGSLRAQPGTAHGALTWRPRCWLR